MKKEEEIKKLIEELIPLLDLSEKNRIIGLIEGMLVIKNSKIS